jgi:hypothetical protein
LAVGIFLLGSSQPLFASVAPTTTTLAITSGGNAVTTVSSGSVITLTASVMAGSAGVTPGQVQFCDATAPHCTDIHRLGITQLTTAGTATFRFVPGIGTHSYKAIFSGTTGDAASSSSATALTVNGAYPSATSFEQTGSAGNYTLTATVSGYAGFSPTGTVSFLDTSNVNTVLATANLGPGKTTAGLSFMQASSSATNITPQAVAVADFNGDGKLDLALPGNPNAAGSVLTVLLGKGDGTFTPAPPSPTPALNVGSIAAGDFNGDGKADLIVNLPDNNELMPLLGKGDGTFTVGQTISDPDGPFFVATADFNGDGNADLAVANPAGANVTILLGNGDGTFAAASTSAAGASPASIAVGDFDGDGHADVAVVNLLSNTVTVLLGKGNGTFTKVAVSPATGTDPLSITTGDFNGDGKADLAVANSYVTTDDPGTVTILLGNGDGTFTPNAVSPATGDKPYCVAVADVNGDGKADLVTSNMGSNTATVLLGNGDGTFTAGGSPPAGIDPLFVGVGDMNGDGIADLAVVNNSASLVTVLLSKLAQVSAAATVSGISPTGTGTHMVNASYDGDSNYSASVSGAIGLTAEPVIAPDFSIKANPASITIKQGGSGSAVLTITPARGFSQTLQLSCSGVPANSTCSFSPASVTPRLRRRKLSGSKDNSMRVLLALGAMTLGIGMLGCGTGGIGNQGSGPISPTGTSTVTVAASSIASGGPSHTANVTVIITN